jgi:5-methylcytosine-specific restriction endonuclease McrA
MDDFSVHAKPVANIDGIACDTEDPMLMPMAHLEAQICELAGHIAAATCRYLLLVADFDAREGWRAWEQPSCAAWLAWKCQVAPATAREHVRVARALKELPVIRGKFAAGLFSYSKARALTRIATPDTEQGLVDMARHMTAGQIDRFAHAHRKVSQGNRQPSHERKLTWRVNDDGTISVSATLPPEDGAVFLQALRASRDDLEHPHDGDLENGEPPHRPGDRVPVEDLADALTDVCTSYLRAKIARADNPDIYQVIIHAGAAAITNDAGSDAPQPQDQPAGASAEASDAPGPGQVDASIVQPRWPIWHPAREDRCHAADGPAISAVALQLIGCNATISTMVHDADGAVLAVGRRTRTAPAALRRAVRERDHHRCRFPGCESRKVDLHHIQHWSNGGPTSRDNLILLCRRHHRVVHDKGYIITAARQFHTRDGKPIPHSPTLPRRTGDITTSHDATIAYHTIVPPCSGERLNLHDAIYICFANAKNKADKADRAAGHQQVPRAA